MKNGNNAKSKAILFECCLSILICVHPLSHILQEASTKWTEHHNIKGETYRNLPSWAAAPPVIILVMKILESSPICGLSVPPAMLKPSPEFPWGQREKKIHDSKNYCY
jgi:hypothetical protein